MRFESSTLSTVVPQGESALAYGSTSVLSHKQVVQSYKLRFPIEFTLRNAKQSTGLEDCQARDLVKLEFHFNASLTALHLAKVETHHQHSGQERIPSP